MKKEIAIELIEEWSGKVPIATFQERLTAALATVPPEYRDACSVEVHCTYYDDEGYRLALVYERAETAAETRARKLESLRRAQQAYERAKAEAGGDA